MIEVTCYGCGSRQHTPYATENGCSLVKCSGCGLLYVNPRPSDEEIEEGVQMGVHRGQQALDSTGRYVAAKAAIYHKVLPDIYGTDLQRQKGTWLDVGCGHGELLVVLRDLCGTNVTARGIEPNKNKIAAAHKKGLNVDYFDLASHEERYDCISLLNVYSHLINPRDFLQLVKQRLKPNGELLLETGDSANLPADEHPRPFLLPDHLSFASEQTLTNMIKELGFEIIIVKKYPSLKLWIMKERILKEVIKVAIPYKKSQLPAMYNEFRVGKYRTDMWIRARVAT